MNEEELVGLLKSRNTVIVFEDDMMIVGVTKESDGSRRNVVIMKYWHNGKYAIISDLKYSLIGRFFLRLGIYWIGVKGLSAI
jgi:hypothetical protein